MRFTKIAVCAFASLASTFAKKAKVQAE